MKIIFLITVILYSNISLAITQSGKITGYVPYSSGGKEIIIFKLENNVSSACNSTARFAMDNTLPRYKATLSAVIAAFHSQSTIKVNYLSSCNAWGNSADVNYICVGNINC